MSSEHRPDEIVIVDPDRDICEALATFVVADGYRSAIFTAGRDALDYLNGDAVPVLILVDASMSALDGWRFLEELGKSARTASVPTFLMSADTRLDAERARDLGARAVLRKPFDLSSLSVVIHSHCST
jgi:DNA-binding response OmpR family regulator